MISNNDYIKQSLALHLFFARIMKEHCFFLRIAFTPRDRNLSEQADSLGKAFDALLEDSIKLSNGVVNPAVLQSGEVITQYTLNAELATSYLTGIQIRTDLTRIEAGLTGGGLVDSRTLEQTVNQLNDNALKLIALLIQFKSIILTNVLSCKVFTSNYPLLIDHILREAKFYQMMMQRLQAREDNIEKGEFEQENFWNEIMGNHAEFIRGLLDPTEKALMITANNLANEFGDLTNDAKKAMDKTMPPQKMTRDSLNATMKIREFKTAATQGLLECKIKSIILPLLSDHVLREANHYLRLLNMFNK